MSKQLDWQTRNITAGNCGTCGKPRGDSPSVRNCRRCALRIRARVRRRTGCKPWRPGGLGRPPKVR